MSVITKTVILHAIASLMVAVILAAFGLRNMEFKPASWNFGLLTILGPTIMMLGLPLLVVSVLVGILLHRSGKVFSLWLHGLYWMTLFAVIGGCVGAFGSVMRGFADLTDFDFPPAIPTLVVVLAGIAVAGLSSRMLKRPKRHAPE